MLQIYSNERKDERIRHTSLVKILNKSSYPTEAASILFLHLFCASSTPSQSQHLFSELLFALLTCNRTPLPPTSATSPFRCEQRDS